MSIGTNLDDFVPSQCLKGQVELAQAIGNLITDVLPEHEEKFRTWPDSVFLEPRLFTCFSENPPSSTQINQILYGGLSPAERPKDLEVVSDSSGVICVPGVGWFQTELSNAALTLTYDHRGDIYSLCNGAASVNFGLLPALKIPGTNTELVRAPDPVLDSFIRRHCPGSPGMEYVHKPEAYLSTIATAFSVVRACSPSFYEALVDGVKLILLFRQPGASSFAALGAHGAVFLNLLEHDTLPYFIDQLVHQGGHIVFSAATLRRQDFFLVDPDSSLSGSSASGRRTVYDALHGLYTEYAVTSVLRQADEQGLLIGEPRVELLGRLALTTKRYSADIQKINAESGRIFTDLGLKLFTWFREACTSLLVERPELLTYDCSGQVSQQLDFEEFMRRNPGLPAALSTRSVA